MMKWDVKHDRAKRVIDTFLEGAMNWQSTGEFTIPKRSELDGRVTEEERKLVSEEVALMIASIRKRYKLQERLPEQAAVETAQEIEQAAEQAKEAVQEQAEEVKAEEPVEKEPEKPKRVRKASTGEKKATTRRKKKEVQEEEQE